MLNLDWEQIRKDITEDILTKHVQHGREALLPAIDLILGNIQTVCEAYIEFPDTLVTLLNQVMFPFTKSDYERDVLAVINQKARAAKDRDTAKAFIYIEKGLGNLRSFLGYDSKFLEDKFHLEIAMLSGEDKVQQFNTIINAACKNAIEQVVEKIQNATTPAQNIARARRGHGGMRCVIL